MKEKLKVRSKTESEVYLICNDVLMFSERVVVPLSRQKHILKVFHTGHHGISRMKSLMRSYVNWRSMHRDLKSSVISCKGCTLVAKVPPIKFKAWPETDHHIDIAGPLNGLYYLILVESLSK